MAQQLTLETQHQLFASMLLQLSSQTKQHEELEQKLEGMNKKLAHAYKEISMKSRVIDSLEVDIEHLIDQLSKIRNKNNKLASSHSRWMQKNLPGFSATQISEQQVNVN